MQTLLIVLVGVVALYAFLWARGRLQVRRGARNISRILEDTFQEERRPVRVDPAQFSWLDVAFYDQAQHNLEAEGFQLLANVEDETFSVAHPDKRTYVRLLNLPDGSIRAAIYEIVVGGPQGRPRTTVRVVELLTELSDGGCVNTTTAPASRLLDAPRGLSREHLSAAIAPRDHLAMHRSHLERVLSERPGVAISPVRTYDEAIAAWLRGNARQRSRLAEQGGLNREELRRMAGPGRQAVADAVFTEMQRQRRR